MDYKEKVIALLDSEELSQEQKEKLEQIFPELKESEDEKIRKWLIAQLYIKIGDNIDLNNMIYNAIAWLEKQGEQKSFDYENVNITQKDFAPKKHL